MIYLAYISLFFVGIQLVNVVLNLVFQQKIRYSGTSNNDLLSILIPARNEEKNILLLLSDLQKSMQHNVEIIVFDDESVDGTAKLVRDFAKHDKRIVLIQSDGLPEGWLGKNYACYKLAENATGKHFLFLDADVRIHGSVISEAVGYLKKYNLKLLSVFPIQQRITFGEKISVPIMNYILLTLLPLLFVRVSPFRSHAAANGQFMLFDAETYKKIQPHLLFKKSAVEDIGIARYYKKEKIKIACLTGEKRIECRMYSSYVEALNGFSKNVFMYFGNMPVVAFLFWCFSAFGFVPVLIALPQFIAYYVVILIVILMVYSFISKQNIGVNIVLFPLQLVFLITIVGNAFLMMKHKSLEWKERSIY